MSFDPSQPANHSPLVSKVIRDQFIALFQLIQSIPAGPQGPEGPQGPPFAQAVIDAVTTLASTENATVSVSFDGTNVRFTFGIPRGADGLQGPPGEVSIGQMDAAIATAISGTSPNTNIISTLDTVPSDPPSFSDYEALRAKVNELVLNGKRG